MPQLQAYLEMDSTDEKMHKKMQLIREAEAKEMSKKKQKELARAKLDPATKDNMQSMSSADYEPTQQQPSERPRAQDQQPLWPSEETGTQQRKAPRKAMQIGKPKKQNEMMKELTKEHLFTKAEIVTQEEIKTEEPVNVLAENVVIEIHEKVNCMMSKDGDLEKFEIKGAVHMTLNDAKRNNPLVQMNFKNIKGFVFKPHPEINKQKWNKGKSICASDQDNGFSAHQKLQAVQYRYSSKEEVSYYD